MLENYNLLGKLALITGGAGLLGVQHALALAECGATVVLADINEEELAQARLKILKEMPSAEVLTYVVDVTDRNMITQILHSLLSHYEQVDILVNNAAIDPKVNDEGGLIETSRFENYALEQWNFQLSVGLTGAFLCSQVLGTLMANKKGGVILNIASDLSVIAPDQRLYKNESLAAAQQPVKPVTYSVIKTGLIGLTRYLAAYWADKNVRVNALSPGGVYAGQSAEFVHKLTNLIPMQRMATLDEYRGAVQFLCSEASRYMTGQNIILDGGRTII